MAANSPAWLTAATIFAPIIASFGVLWLSNRQQAQNLRAQHALALEKDKIAAVVSKAEELYSDIQRWKKHIEMDGIQRAILFQMSASNKEFLDRAAEKSSAIEFDLVRLELNLKAYFSELEPSFRAAQALVHVAGTIHADMIMRFPASADERRKIAGNYVTAQQAGMAALDEFSSALAARIGALVEVERS